MNWYTTSSEQISIDIRDIPVLPYPAFYETVREALSQPGCHCTHYFGAPDEQGLALWFILLNDREHSVSVCGWQHNYYGEHAPASLTALFPALHPFEREITETFGIHFKDQPYDRPLRFSHNRADRGSSVCGYPFYSMDSPALHEVNVGPIHAGIIEPGAFRFICHGEEILHLEVVLGYQHRGVEQLIRDSDNILRQTCLAESVAGDSAISHAGAYCRLLEMLHGFDSRSLERERAVAQELERIAMHIADTGALCGDIGYQLGQVGCEALRTLIVNSLLAWCGNRFGKGLTRPFGNYYPLTREKADIIDDRVREVRDRFREIAHDLLTTPSVLARFEDCCPVSRTEMERVGGVGMAARASGLPRDIRYTHPYSVYRGLIDHQPVLAEGGDVLARLKVRTAEVVNSAETIVRLLATDIQPSDRKPMYHLPAPAMRLAVSLTEGWRGEICHAGLTGPQGQWTVYKIKDPSLHNWYALSLAVRGAGISDFPVCNKSFNLSYCGHDL